MFQNERIRIYSSRSVNYFPMKIEKNATSVPSSVPNTLCDLLVHRRN